MCKKLIIFLFIFHYATTRNFAQQFTDSTQNEINRVLLSIGLETIVSNNTFVNLMYENDFKKRITLIYGLEYIRNSSKISVNGQIVNSSINQYFLLKAKAYYYFRTFNKKYSAYNGCYFGPSLRAGIGERSDGFYNSLLIGPGITIGSSLPISSKITLNIELELDWYLEWKKENDTNDNYQYEGKMYSYPFIWLSLGYRL
jgi:hypothetical protein